MRDVSPDDYELANSGKSIYILDKGEQGDDKHSTDKRYEKTCLFL